MTAIAQPSAAAANRTRTITALALLIFVLGLGVRAVRLTAPLDRPTLRPLHGAIVARGIYYQLDQNADPAIRQKAIDLANAEPFFEPRVFETIVALTYLGVGKEVLWISRLYSILFWMIGGIALFDLARRISSPGAALIALIFYLFTPLGVEFSRKFQPDSFMVMWFLIAADLLYVWMLKRTWTYAILGGLVSGIAVFSKIQCALPVGIMGVFLVLGSMGIKKAIRSLQVWVVFLLMVGIPAVYYFFINQGSASGYFSFWTLSLLYMIADPSFYPRWLFFLFGLFGGPFVVGAPLGLLFAKAKDRLYIGGMLLGYFLFGLTLPFLIQTHNYYSLILIPMLALGLAPLSEALFERFSQERTAVQALAAAVVLVGMGYTAWIDRNFVVQLPEPAAEATAWKHMAEDLPADGRIIGLVQDYGIKLHYYGNRGDVAAWPSTLDLNLMKVRTGQEATDFEGFFRSATSGYRYFLVTDFSDLEKQPDLESTLEDHYPVIETGDGYVLYDLNRKKPAP